MSKETLYILMRNDMDSMNAGKACAQASHASNAFVHKFHNTMRSVNSVDPDNNKVNSEYLNKSFYAWENATPQGFGTTIVLGVNENQMNNAVSNLSDNFISGIVHDPTYPVKDGTITHLIPVDTCAFVFAPDRDDPYIKMHLGKFSLY